MFSKVRKDPVVVALLLILVGLYAVFQIGGGENSSHVLIRDCINVFWYVAFPVLLAYLLIRPILQRSIEKSSSLRARVFKTFLGVVASILIAAIGLYLLFSIVFGLVMSGG
jgi:hypothetical protein